MTSGKVESKNKLTQSMVEKTTLAKIEEDIKLVSSITPYLLLLALSLHGFFEGVALGVQGNVQGALKLVFAILAHKWAEAFTLVIILLLILLLFT